LGTAQPDKLLWALSFTGEKREEYMTSRLSLVLVLCCLGAALLNAAETPQTVLLVLAKTDQALFLVNPATLAVVGQVPSGPDPHEVIASADGTFAYISNYGGGSYNTITVVDLVNQVALPAIDLGALRGPHGLTFVGGKLWFTAEGAKVIGSYDPATKKIDWVLGTGQDRTHMIYVFPGLNRILTSNVSSATMTVIEKTNGPTRGFRPGPGGPPPPAGPGMPNGPGGLAGGGPMGTPQINWTETVIPVGHGAEGFDVSPDGREIWVANAQDGTISIIDVASKKVAQTLDANVRGANRLKFTPDGKLVFVSSLGSPDLVVLDATTRKEVKRVKIGRGAAGILMQPDGLRAYVACTPDDYVAVIDLKSLEMTGKIAAGKQPDGLAWAVRK
jgi:YVTN family beta-propeller protein